MHKHIFVHPTRVQREIFMCRFNHFLLNHRDCSVDFFLLPLASFTLRQNYFRSLFACDSSRTTFRYFIFCGFFGLSRNHTNDTFSLHVTQHNHSVYEIFRRMGFGQVVFRAEHQTLIHSVSFPGRGAQSERVRKPEQSPVSPSLCRRFERQ